MTKDCLAAVRCVLEGFLSGSGLRLIVSLLAVDLWGSVVGKVEGVRRVLDWLASVRCVREVTLNGSAPPLTCCLLVLQSCWPIGRGVDLIGGFLARLAASRAGDKKAFARDRHNSSMSSSSSLS